MPPTRCVNTPGDMQIEAMTRDVSILFTRFDKKESIRFEDFTETWKELNFSFIHSGRKTMNDKIKATKRLLRIVISYFSPDTPFQFRIAAIYTSYSVYYTQLCNPKVRIRMTPTMWKDLKEVHQLVRRHEHLDVDYVIQKLMNDKAFVFTAMPTPLEYGRREYMLNVEASTTIETFRNNYKPDEYVIDLLQNLDPIEKLAHLEDEYAEVKKKIIKDLWQDKESQVPKSLSAIEENFHSPLLNDTEEFQEWLEVNTSYGKEIVDKSQRPVPKLFRLQDKESQRPSSSTATEASITKPNVIMSRVERIAALKMKSFGHVGLDRHKTQLLSDQDVEKEQQEMEQGPPKQIIHYRRSALREQCQMRGWQKSWQRNRGTRRTKEQIIQDELEHMQNDQSQGNLKKDQ